MSNKSKQKLATKHYCQIIPLVRLSLVKSSEFTYHSNKIVEFGSVVKIKFNNKIIRGVVVDEFNHKQFYTDQTTKSNIPAIKKINTIKQQSKQKPTFKTSPILEIITPAQITRQQLKLAKLISQYYLTPLSTTLKFFAFKLTKKNNPKYFENITKQVKEINENKWQKKIILTAEQKKATGKIITPTLKRNTTLINTKSANNSKKLLTFDIRHSTLLFGPPASGKTEVIIETIKKTLEQNQQSLILIPEIFLSYQEIVRYSSKFIDNNDSNKEVAILHSQLKPSEITTIWNGVKSSKIKIIISTRMGVFLPFKDLGLIVVDEEQDISHKQWDTPPFYHTRQVASLLQEVYSKGNIRTKVLLASSTPSLNSYYKTTTSKKWQLVKLPALKTREIAVKPPTIELVDLKKYYKKGQQIFLSNELRFALKNTLNQNKIALLLVPRRGKSSTIICQDCQEVPICPDCQVPLVHSENSYRCLHCNFKISNISKCPHCGSFRLSDLGFGTESVRDAIQTTFPSARIAVADSLTFKSKITRQTILSNLYNNKLDFLVGTYTIAKGLDIKDVNLVAILNADNWPGQTDFRFDENYLSTIFQLAGRVNRPGAIQNGKCLIQTFDPTNRIFTYLKDWDWKAFAEYELENRKSLNYPPFKHLIKITYRNYNKELVEKELDRLYKKLTKYQKEQESTKGNQHHNKNISEAIELGDSRYNETTADIYFPFREATRQQPIQLLEPYYGFQEKLRGQWHKHLLLKIPTLPIANKKLLKILDLPTGWKIDVDTENVF